MLYHCRSFVRPMYDTCFSYPKIAANHVPKAREKRPGDEVE